MSAGGGRAQNRVRILLEFLVRHTIWRNNLLNISICAGLTVNIPYRVVLCIQRKQWDTNGLQ